MRGAILSILAGSALALGATAANAAVTLGAFGSSCTGAGCSAGTFVPVVTDNVNVPNKIEFDTTNVTSAGTVTSYFDFMESYAFTGIFSVTTATNPGSTVTLIDLLNGTTLASITNSTGSSFALNLITGPLAANTTYRLKYTVNAQAGNISGVGTLYAVPEPATWALMLLGFAGIGMAMRRSRRPVFAQVA
jgi:hypothetical protein